MATQDDWTFHQEVVDAFTYYLGDITEDLYEFMFHSAQFQLNTDSTDCQWWLHFCQWWLDGINNPHVLVIDHLCEVEQAAVGFDFDQLRSWMIHNPRYKKCIVGSVFMKDIYPRGPPIALFQMQLEKLKENIKAAELELADKQLEGWLKVLGVETDAKVDELLMLEQTSLDLEYLDELVLLGQPSLDLLEVTNGDVLYSDKNANLKNK